VSKRSVGKPVPVRDAELLAEALPAQPEPAPEAASLLQESESYVRAVAAATLELAQRGFVAPFDVYDDDIVHCLSCRSKLAPGDVNWICGIEVADGDEQCAVCGVRCPICGARGTATATIEQWSRRRHPTARPH
jgi:hypothetical protein